MKSKKSPKLKFIDLSIPIESVPSDPEFMIPRLEYVDHQAGLASAQELLGCRPEDLPLHLGWAVERVTLSTHSGTHLDAPWHYAPISQGKKAKTIDQIPLEWCYGDGVVLDFHHKKKSEGISAREVQEALKKIGYTLKPWDIVLIRTDTYKRYHEPGYEYMHPGMTREATRWLIEQGIKVMGTDASGNPTITQQAAGYYYTGQVLPASATGASPTAQLVETDQGWVWVDPAKPGWQMPSGLPSGSKPISVSSGESLYHQNPDGSLSLLVDGGSNDWQAFTSDAGIFRVNAKTGQVDKIADMPMSETDKQQLELQRQQNAIQAAQLGYRGVQLTYGGTQYKQVTPEAQVMAGGEPHVAFEQQPVGAPQGAAWQPTPAVPQANAAAIGEGTPMSQQKALGLAQAVAQAPAGVPIWWRLGAVGPASGPISKGGAEREYQRQQRAASRQEGYANIEANASVLPMAPAAATIAGRAAPGPAATAGPVKPAPPAPSPPAGPTIAGRAGQTPFEAWWDEQRRKKQAAGLA
jgi:hypothetical protein